MCRAAYKARLILLLIVCLSFSMAQISCTREATIEKLDALRTRLSEIDELTLYDFGSSASQSQAELNNQIHSAIDINGFRQFIPHLNHSSGPIVLVAKFQMLMIGRDKKTDTETRITIFLYPFSIRIHGISGIFKFEKDMGLRWAEYIDQLVSEKLIPLRLQRNKERGI